MKPKTIPVHLEPQWTTGELLSTAPLFVSLGHVVVNVNAIVSMETVEMNYTMLSLSGGHREFVSMELSDVIEAIDQAVSS